MILAEKQKEFVNGLMTSSDSLACSSSPLEFYDVS